MTQKLFGTKVFWSPLIFFYPKFLLTPINFFNCNFFPFYPKIIFQHNKIFQPKNSFWPNKISWNEKFLNPKVFLTQNIFLTKKLTKKIIKKIWPKIFLYQTYLFYQKRVLKKSITTDPIFNQRGLSFALLSPSCPTNLFNPRNFSCYEQLKKWRCH